MTVRDDFTLRRAIVRSRRGGLGLGWCAATRPSASAGRPRSGPMRACRGRAGRG